MTPSPRRHARASSAIAACTAVAARRPPPANSKGDAYEYCKACHPGAIQARWTREPVRDAMRARRERSGTPPSSYDRSRTHPRHRGGEPFARRPARGAVTDLYGAWAATHADAVPDESSS